MPLQAGNIHPVNPEGLRPAGADAANGEGTARRDAEPLVELRNVAMTYDRREVLRNVDMTVARGDFAAITGPNGGGKTTLLRIMLKLLKPTRGEVRYLRHGHEVKHLSIGYLPQKSMIDTSFPVTVGEVIRSGLLKGFFSRFSADDEEQLRRTVDMVGVGDYLDRQIGRLSGGQLQRALLGRALVSNPEVLVLDEPLSYVDKAFERQIYCIIEELAKTKTIVLVSHEMSVIAGMANRHYIVDHDVHLCSAHKHYIPNDCE